MTTIKCKDCQKVLLVSEKIENKEEYQCADCYSISTGGS